MPNGRPKIQGINIAGRRRKAVMAAIRQPRVFLQYHEYRTVSQSTVLWRPVELVPFVRCKFGDFAQLRFLPERAEGTGMNWQFVAITQVLYPLGERAAERSTSA